MTWQPGDPIHTTIDETTTTRPMFEVLPERHREVCICPDAARWPVPRGGNELPQGDEIGRVIREAKESAA